MAFKLEQVILSDSYRRRAGWAHNRGVLHARRVQPHPMLHHLQHRGVSGHLEATQELANYCLLPLLSHRARHAHGRIYLPPKVLFRYRGSQEALGNFQD